jgi:hypothetical protein
MIDNETAITIGQQITRELDQIKSLQATAEQRLRERKRAH